MPTITEMNHEQRERLRVMAVEQLERLCRSVLALGLTDHPRAAELAARITSGELLPRIEIRLNSGPLLVVWGDDATDETEPVWLFAVGDHEPDTGKSTPSPGSSQLN